MLLKQKNLNLDLSKSNGIWISKLNTGISELSIYVEEEIKEVDKLKDLLDLFQLIMNELKARNFIVKE
jgi:ferritin